MKNHTLSPSKISVIIPAYNAAKFLPATLDSVLSQNYQPLEVIIVDDGSKDETAVVASRYLNDERVHYLHQENGGLPVARNTGIKAATGEAIMFVDSDDLLPEGAVSTLANELSMVGDEYCAVHGEMEHFDSETRAILKRTDYKAVSRSRRKLLNTRANFLLTCLIRKAAIEKSGLFHSEMQSASEDIDFIFRLSKVGRFKAVDAVVYRYRRHTESKTHNFTPEYAASVTNEHRLMLKRVLKGESLLMRIEAWATYYFWAGVDFHRHDRFKAQRLWAIAFALNPFNIEPLFLIRASLLNKLE
ncbi:MAG: glycosyltransferase family 2 protein [Leptolyngbya sp. BL-A-14]